MSRQEIVAELREWKQLLDDGLVTEEEFQTHRQQLMAQLKQHSVSSSPGASPPAAPSGASFFGTGGNPPPAFAPQAASGASFFGTGGSTPGPPVASGASFFGTGGVVPGHNTKGQVGQTLASRYRLDALLGVGGMGEVYKATDTLSNTVCALKWIRPELAGNEQLRQRFVHELQVTQRLTHPGIVRTYALAQDRERGALFFTMEYVEGESLEDLLNHAEAEGRVPPVPVEKALEWLKTLAEALAFAHEEGILHRDLKPANIMVDQRGRLRLMDFGIAKAMGQATQLHTGYVGTPVYMPPEQLRGGKATPASDLYSFGAVAYQLLTGQLPLGRFRNPRELVPAVPATLDASVMRCLEQQPESRFETMKAWLASLSSSRTSPSRPQRPRLSSGPPPQTELGPDGFPAEAFTVRRECPNCAEQVLRKARQCKDCGHEFADAELQRRWVQHLEQEARRLGCPLEKVETHLEEEALHAALNAWKIEHSRLADKESMEEWWKEKASTLRRENTRQRLQEAVEEKIPVALRAIDKKSLHQWGQEWSQKAWEEYTPEQALDWWTQKQAQLHLQSSYPALQRQGEQAASENKERRKEAGEASYCQQVLDVWGEADVHKMTMEQVEAWWPEALNNVELGPSRAVLEKARLKALRPFAGTQRALEVLPEAREIYCPAGTFRMGASPGDDEALECEKPAREVTLTCGFWALSTPVTQAMYKAVMGENPSKFKGESRPVENVSWYDAVEFCNQLSHKAGLSPAYQTEKATGFFSGFFGDGKVAWLQESEGYRLPTEAEWEYFCRAGSTGSRYGNLDEIAWYKENSDNRTSPVGQKAPNAWGFYDTLGNVWEWCVDKWDEQAYSRLPQLNPAHLPHSADKRVRRGGGWSSDTRGSRASYRFWDVASLRYNHGFRVVRTSVVRAKQ